MPYSCDTSKYDKKMSPYVIPGADGAFKFLAICQYSKKKGVDPLLKAYFSEFTPEDNALLIFKTYFGPNDGPAEREKMRGIIQVIQKALRLKSYPRVQLIHEVLSFEDVERLYATADCYCLPSRGEGWGVPHFDAMGHGLPIIATQGTGPEEFIYAPGQNAGWLVRSHSSPCVDMPHPHDFMYTAKDNWMEPEVGHLMKCMREAYDLKKHNPSRWDIMSQDARSNAKCYDNSLIGPRLRDVILKYYKMWSESNG